MTDLRDARLRRALDSAPDADAKPPASVRSAVREAAANAVRPKAEPWWRALWPQPGNRMPWNAAFATVLLAVLVTLVWRDEEVPGARPESGRVDPPMPSRDAASVPVTQTSPPAAPDAAAATDAVVPPAATTRSARAPVPAAAVERRTPEARPVQPKLELAADAEAQGKVAAAAMNKAATGDRRRRADSAGVPAESAGTSTPAASPATQPPSPAAPAPKVAAPSPAPAEPPQASVAAAAPPPRAAPPAMAAREARSESALQGRTRFADARPAGTMRIARRGQSLTVQRDASPVLSRAIDAAIASSDSAEALASPVQARIELEAGTLEIANAQVRWQPLDGPARTGRPPDGVLRELQDEIERLLR